MSDHRPTTNGVTESDRGLDERLRRLMQPPPDEHLAQIAHRAIQEVSPTRARYGRRRVLGQLAAAAAVVAGLAGSWLIGQSLRPPRSGPPRAYTPGPWPFPQPAGTASPADRLAPLARPLFAWNHDYVMRNGGRGLARLLDARLLASS